VEAAEQAWRPLGELLLSKNLIAKAELDVALAEQEETGKLLGAILVDRGFISGPALAIALAEQYGVELDQQQGFGTGLWAEIERRHRSERGIDEPEAPESPRPTATIVKLEPMQPPPSLEAVPDPEPDPQLGELEAQNQRLQEEIERLHSEFTKLRVIEAELREQQPDPDPGPDPQLAQLEGENSRLEEELERVRSELTELRAIEAELREQQPDPEPDPQLAQLEGENSRLEEELERVRSELTELRAIEAELREQQPDPEPELPKSHVLFVPTPRRYLLLEREGPPPDAGTEVSLSEGSFVVGKIGRAPVPGERRACAFLLGR
jgi:DNA repair exonuclease SbcCD ATPase subunit